MSRVPVPPRKAVVLCVATALLAAGCGSDGGDKDGDESREVVLSFDDGLESTGAAALDVSTVTAGGGSVEEEPRGDGTALRFPAFAPADATLAGLAVVDGEGEDDLAPGTSTFSFGAEFVVDEQSSGSPVDNGDNIVQRGLFGAESQYKLQLDGDRLSCRVKGADGEVEVAVGEEVTPGEWYRGTCTRYESRVELELVRLDDDETWKETTNGETGELTVSSSVPFTVGVKISEQGDLMEQDSDQFNGVIDEVFLDILR